MTPKQAAAKQQETKQEEEIFLEDPMFQDIDDEEQVEFDDDEYDIDLDYYEIPF